MVFISKDKEEINMSKRGENIYKRKDGRWEARILIHDPNGKVKYKCLYAKTYKEVKNKKNIFLQHACSNIKAFDKRDISFDVISELWLKNMKNSIKESTYIRYSQMIHRYLIPNVGGKRIKEFTLDELSYFINFLLERGGHNQKPLSAKTVTDIICVLKSILKFAEVNNYSHSDYRHIKYPQRSLKQIHILEKEEQERLEKMILQSMSSFDVGILVTLYTGLRLGELCALQWKNINLENNIITVDKTMLRIKNLDENPRRKTKIIIQSPKTKTSLREIPIPDFLSSILKMFKNFDEVFLLSGTEFPIEPHKCYMRYKKILKENGIQEYSFHTLRHTFATRCVEYGFDIKTLSEILGHKDIKTTLSTYVHPSMDSKRKQIEKLKPYYMYKPSMKSSKEEFNFNLK